MSSPSIKDNTFIKTQMLIAAALIVACTIYLAVVIFMVFSSAKEGASATTGWSFDNPMAIIASSMVLLAIPPALVLPRVIHSNSVRVFREQTSEDALAPEVSARSILQTSLIIRLAMIEGPVFFAIFAFFLTKSLIPLAASGLGIVVMMLFFPRPDSTRDRLAEVIQELSR